jgi:hypothetical protein
VERMTSQLFNPPHPRSRSFARYSRLDMTCVTALIRSVSDRAVERLTDVGDSTARQKADRRTKVVYSFLAAAGGLLARN